jgi:uncharacterized membrane protein (DUF106 family)
VGLLIKYAAEARWADWQEMADGNTTMKVFKEQVEGGRERMGERMGREEEEVMQRLKKRCKQEFFAAVCLVYLFVIRITPNISETCGTWIGSAFFCFF